MSRWLRWACAFGALTCATLALLFAAEMPAFASDGPGFQATGSVQQVYVTGVAPGQRMYLRRKGKTVRSKRASELGGVLFRHQKAGGGYRVRLGKKGPTSDALRVLPNRSAPPSTDVYDQNLPSSGYGYMKMRDGIKLAYYVHPPSDVGTVAPVGFPDIPEGTPTPTLIEYSGYGYANPDGPDSGIAVIANLMGFTVVDVNMRGTGCSAGAFDFFEPLQGLDGYDIIETVSRQPWVAGGKVGMMGISYGGISQLFTAARRPPSLAAISPLSVIDQTQTTLYPGGILNTGFALAWAEERQLQAEPASGTGGQRWAWKRIQEGDEVCKKNQTLHAEAANLIGKIRANSHYRPKIADPLSPLTFVNKINVPTFMACQYTDEQTGGHCPTLAENFTGTDKKWFTFTNGTHVDSLAPETFNRWFDFLKIYVAKENPATYSPFIQGASPVIYSEAMGIEGVTMPPDPVQTQPTYGAAKATFEAFKPIRVLFDNGAGGSEPGEPYPGFEAEFDKLPVPGTTARSWFLSAGGSLSDTPAPKRRADSFGWDAYARPLTDFTGNTAAGEGGLWTATPPYRWTQNPKGRALSYVTAPLGSDTTVIGNGFLRLFARSSTPNVDLQVTVTEVRPDGKETFVQGGWLRANERKLDKRKSTPLSPVLSLRERDVRAMPSDRFAKVTVPLYYEGHAYRKDSRIRVIISAPNGDQPIWSFEKTRPKGTAKVAIGYSKKMRSRLTLPVVPDIDAPTELPPCPGLRGEPCRSYQPFANRRAKP